MGTRAKTGTRLRSVMRAREGEGRVFRGMICRHRQEKANLSVKGKQIDLKLTIDNGCNEQGGSQEIGPGSRVLLSKDKRERERTRGGGGGGGTSSKDLRRKNSNDEAT